MKTADPKYLVTCHRYDPEITPGKVDFSLKALDEISSTVGILILQINGHVSHVNSAAFRLAGIDKTTK